MLFHTKKIIGLILIALSFVACSDSNNEQSFAQQSEETMRMDIVDTASAAGSFNTLLAAAGAADLVETLKSEGPFTVFAPTDEAFAKLPKETLDFLLMPENKETLANILLYHVVAGEVLAEQAVTLSEATAVSGQKLNLSLNAGDLFINESKVIATDILTSNGVIHVIDTVLIPASMIEEREEQEQQPAMQDIVDTAIAAGNFNTLVAAVQVADLVETLKSEGPFTVFAPTDEAFAKLPQDTLNFLLMPENKQALTDILLYHVAAKNIGLKEIIKKNFVETVFGQNLKVSVSNKSLFINDSKVLIKPIKVKNGVIYVIDTVLLP